MATTDPSEGLLRALADQEGYRTFPVPPGVDGRMTVLSAVGMLPAAICGCEVDALLAGARAMRVRTATGDVRENPAYLLAALCILTDTRLGKSILVTMPYADALFGLSDWFRQLWAESLGKRLSLDNQVVFTGQTPIKALGAIDQHSQIQLYTEGPNDKLISLIAVGDYRADVTIEGVPTGFPSWIPSGRGAGAAPSARAVGDGLGAHPGAASELHHRGADHRCRHPGRAVLSVRAANGDGRRAAEYQPVRSTRRRSGQERHVRAHGA